jgi:pilus assembly protein Flp/PilA
MVAGCRRPRPPLRPTVLHASIGFFTDESGQGLVEYALIISLVAIVAIAALRVLGEKASDVLSNAAKDLS